MGACQSRNVRSLQNRYTAVIHRTTPASFKVDINFQASVFRNGNSVRWNECQNFGLCCCSSFGVEWIKSLSFFSAQITLTCFGAAFTVINTKFICHNTRNADPFHSVHLLTLIRPTAWFSVTHETGTLLILLHARSSVVIIQCCKSDTRRNDWIIILGRFNVVSPTITTESMNHWARDEISLRSIG